MPIALYVIVLCLYLHFYGQGSIVNILSMSFVRDDTCWQLVVSYLVVYFAMFVSANQTCNAL